MKVHITRLFPCIWAGALCTATLNEEISGASTALSAEFLRSLGVLTLHHCLYVIVLTQMITLLQGASFLKLRIDFI